jgi:hypothetical protein
MSFIAQERNVSPTAAGRFLTALKEIGNSNPERFCQLLYCRERQASLTAKNLRR